MKLSLDELKLLDGKSSEDVQKIIDKANEENSYGFELPIMGKILSESKKKGNLEWTYKKIRSCDYCDKTYDYYRYSRSSRYHYKGEKNYDKPKYYSGIKFNEGFVTLQGHGDMCTDCCTKYKVTETLIDYILDNDLHIEIKKNDYKPSKYLKDPVRICHSCEREMKESEMGRDSTMMGNGTYPSTCPHCGEKSQIFGKSHKNTDKFDVILNPAANDEVIRIKEILNDGKCKLHQTKRNKNKFIIDDGEWRNGSYLLTLNIKDKKYHTNFNFDEKQEVIDLLDSIGYVKVDKSYNI